MITLNIRLFGRLSVQAGEQAVENLELRKVQELFCYLLLKRERPHPRETLADLLWSDGSSSQVKKGLRQVLWQLQTALGNYVGKEDAPVLLVESDWIQLNPQSDLWLDVAEFERAYSQVQGIPGHQLNAAQVELLQMAVQLYQGELLEGWYQDWCLDERVRFHDLYLAMLDKLMDYCEAQQDYETGLIYELRILCHDRARERTHRRVMRLHYLAGDRAAALRQYERCVAALDRELSVPPSRRTAALYEQIKADQLIGSILTTNDDNQALGPDASPLPQIFDHLQQLQHILAEIQRLLQQDMQTIEAYMRNQTQPVYSLTTMVG
jgi:DNA-binding SARP family transcriptional activator